MRGNEEIEMREKIFDINEECKIYAVYSTPGYLQKEHQFDARRWKDASKMFFDTDKIKTTRTLEEFFLKI